MKKIVKILILIMTVVLMKDVYAANYELKELIPVEIETSIHTNNFSYKKFSYKDEKIAFQGIKNLTDETRPISITIALFDKDKKNMGTINYCGAKLNQNEEVNYTINVTKDYLGEGRKTSEIKYIAVISDNIRCRISGHDEYLGQTLKQMGIGKNTTLDSQTMFLIKILSVIGGVLLALFLYQFLFTKRYENFDGDDVRQGYAKVNEELRNEREEELRKNPPKPKEKKKIKSDEVLAQEEKASKEDKSGTDLHNLYK